MAISVFIKEDVRTSIHVYLVKHLFRASIFLYVDLHTIIT